MEEEECVILLTGFGPFDPHSLNLSSKIAEELDGAQFLTINSFQNSNSQEEATLKAKVHTTVIPVCYQKAKKVVLKLLESYLQESNEELCCKKSKKLKAFILLGIHPGKEIKLETRAKNGVHLYLSPCHILHL
jgi:3-deoxy-D-arabino-heptulosonate 7-phosphate (DAHP) synthase